MTSPLFSQIKMVRFSLETFRIRPKSKMENKPNEKIRCAEYKGHVFQVAASKFSVYNLHFILETDLLYISIKRLSYNKRFKENKLKKKGTVAGISIL